MMRYKMSEVMLCSSLNSVPSRQSSELNYFSYYNTSFSTSKDGSVSMGIVNDPKSNYNSIALELWDSKESPLLFAHKNEGEIDTVLYDEIRHQVLSADKAGEVVIQSTKNDCECYLKTKIPDICNIYSVSTLGNVAVLCGESMFEGRFQLIDLEKRGLIGSCRESIGHTEVNSSQMFLKDSGNGGRVILTISGSKIA